MLYTIFCKQDVLIAFLNGPNVCPQATPLIALLCARLLILWCHGVVSRFRNAIKGVACAQTSVPFRNAIKTSCLQKVVYTYVSLFSAL